MPQPFFQPPRNAHRAVLGYTGLSFVIYDLRHTFATRFYQTTKDVVALKEVLGHSSLRTVMKYVHVSAEHINAAMDKYEATMVKPGERERRETIQ